MNFKSYHSCKPSGVPWLGDVPAHWDVRRLKAVCRLAYGDSLPSNARGDGDVPVYGSNGPVGMHIAANTEAPCIVVGRKGSFGKIHYSTRPVFAIDTTYYVDEWHSTANLAWLSRVLGWLQLDAVTRDSAIPGLSREDAYDRSLPLPPLPEQAAIVRYLDHADRRIQRYISAKRKLIGLLEEQKQALIHRAVTRGLDPDVRLQPSGVEWLEEVPEHWEVIRLRYLIKGKLTYGANAAAEYADPDWPRYLRITDFDQDGVLKSNTFRSLPPEVARDYLVQPGDLLLARSGATVGKAFLVPADAGEACYAGYLIRAHPQRALIEPRFLFAFTQGTGYTHWKNSTFILSTIQNISAEKYANLHVSCPPLSEQSEIIRGLNEETAYIDTAIDRARRQIELLREYRTRLIADVVTGKLDVREAAAQLPDEADGLEETT